MSISSYRSVDGRELTITIRGRFDFTTHQAFREAYQTLAERPERYRIDCSQVTYMDSSALGMLLLLRDFAGEETANIQLVDCPPDVRKVLLISNFDQLFEIG